MLVEQEKIRITRGPKECRSRPSINVLFRSASLAFGPRVIGVILTGLLDDGTAGLWQIKDRHGLAYVQDPEEAAHASMPDSAIEHVEVDAIGTIRQLVGLIMQKVAEEVSLPSTDQPSPTLLIENTVALEGNGMQAGIMQLGPVSRYTCPECQGVLVQIEEGGMLRFRCHTGHAYSAKSLLASVDEEIDRSLWSTIRAIEERIFLLRQRSERARANNNLSAAARYDALRIVDHGIGSPPLISHVTILLAATKAMNDCRPQAIRVPCSSFSRSANAISLKCGNDSL